MGKVDIEIFQGRTTVMDIYIDGKPTERFATSDIFRIGLEIAHYLRKGYDVHIQDKNGTLDEQIEDVVAELVGGADSGILSVE